MLEIARKKAPKAKFKVDITDFKTKLRFEVMLYLFSAIGSANLSQLKEKN
jgi:hypothetical protein